MVGTPLIPVLAEQAKVDGIPFLGEVHLDHDKILVRLFHDVGLAEGNFLQGPAGGAPGGIEVDDHRLMRLSGIRQDLIRIGFPVYPRTTQRPGTQQEGGDGPHPPGRQWS